MPHNKFQIQTKTFSNSTESSIDKTVILEGDVPLENMNGFVVALYDNKWYLGCVLNVFEDSNEVKISFLQPHGPSPSFTFLPRADILLVPTCNVLAKVNVSTATGRTYNLTKEDKRLLTKFSAVANARNT